MVSYQHGHGRPKQQLQGGNAAANCSISGSSDACCAAFAAQRSWPVQPWLKDAWQDIAGIQKV